MTPESVLMGHHVLTQLAPMNVYAIQGIHRNVTFSQYRDLKDQNSYLNFCENINECETGEHNCTEYSVQAVCRDTIGSFECVCQTGFEGNGFECNNIDECQSDYYYDSNYNYHRRCPYNSVCVDTDGSYKCVCNSGQSGSGTVCENINECETGMHTCPDNANCVDTENSYYCECSSGFEGNGSICTNINECELYNHLCSSPSSRCVDTPGSFDCVCNSGFTGDSSFCQDIDECQGESQINCADNANCVNTPGSYYCECRAGFEGNGFVCTKVTCQYCPDYSECVNDACTCRPGFFEFGGACLNVDECYEETHSCSQFASCTDIFGSYSCKCNRGYFGNGIQCDPVLTCQAGSYLSVEGVCLQCPSNSFSSISRNTLRKCVPCPRGWITNGPGKTSASECRSKYNNAFSI